MGARIPGGDDTRRPPHRLLDGLAGRVVVVLTNRSRPAPPSQVMSEKGWWEAEDNPEEETRQVADLAKGYSEDEGGGVWTLQQIVVGVILLLMILDLLF